MIHDVWVFSKDGARLSRVTDEELAKLDPHKVSINPDLHDVNGIPPHEWVLRDGKIAHKHSGHVISSRPMAGAKILPKKRVYWRPIINAFVSGAMGALVVHLLIRHI